MPKKWDFADVTDALVDILIFSGLAWVIVRIWLSVWHMLFQ